MVILQFNKLIRNKWVWGVFAILVSLAFCFDDLFRSDDRSGRVDESVANLAIEYDANLDRDAQDIIRCFLPNVAAEDREETQRRIYAALSTLGDAGLAVSDAELAAAVREMYLSKYDNDPAAYRDYLKQRYRMDVNRFEHLLREFILVNRGAGVMASVSSWVPPMEKAQALHDLTDMFEVSVVAFKRTADDEKAEVTDEMLKEWYDAHKEKVALPARVTLDYIHFLRSDTNLVADAEITGEEIAKRYEEDKAEKYTTTDTNGVETVTALTEVSDAISKTLAKEAREAKFTALKDEISAAMDQANEEAMNNPDAKKDLLAKISAEKGGLKIESSDWLPAGPVAGLLPGLVASPSSVFRGANVTGQTLSSFDAEIYGVCYPYALYETRDGSGFWLVMLTGSKSAAEAPLEEIKEHVEKPVKEDLALGAFTNRVNAICKGGADAVLKSEAQDGAPAELPAFSLSDPKAAIDEIKFEPKNDVIAAAAGLNKGGMSELILSRDGKKACVVICRNRTTNADKAVLADADTGARAASMVHSRHGASNPGRWLEANARTLGFAAEDAGEEPSAD